MSDQLLTNSFPIVSFYIYLHIFILSGKIVVEIHFICKITWLITLQIEVSYNEQYLPVYLRKTCYTQYRYLSLRGYCPLLQIVDDCSVRLCSLNHNKRSVRLDLSRPEGRDVFLQPVPLSPAPEMGQHTHEVLQELQGMDDDALKRLEQKGVI